MLLRPAPLSLALAVTLFAGAARAADPLVWKWSEGDSARYRMTQRMGMTINAGPAGKVSTQTENVTLMRWNVDRVTDDGAAELSQSAERIVLKTEGPMGQGFTYDSDSEDPPAGMAAMVAPMFEAMCEHDFVVTMLPSGEITDIEVSEPLAVAFDKLPGGAVSGEMIEQTAKQASLRFPEKPLEVGDEWTNTSEVDTPQMGPMRVKTTYVYEGTREVDGQPLEAFTPRIDLEALGGPGVAAQVSIATKDSDGEVLFDREAGRLVKSRIQQTMEVTVKVGGRSIVNEVEQTVELALLGPDEQADFPAADEAAEGSMAEPAATE